MAVDPLRARSTTRPGILDGIRVLELGGRGPVPFAGSMLADHGARVVRIDRTEEARTAQRDPNYRIHPLRRGKESAALDLRDAEVRAAILCAVERMDILIEGFRPGAAERLGLGPEECMDRNPALIYARMGGWGSDTESPMALAPGHDINYLAMSGILGAIGTQESGPVPPLNLAGDYATGALLSWGIMAALYERESSGRGQVVASSIYEGCRYYMRRFFGLVDSGHWVDHPQSNDVDGGAPWYRAYRTSDHKFMAVGAIEDKFYSAFVTGLGLTEGQLPTRTDRRHWSDLAETFAKRFAKDTQAEWWGTFRHLDACVTPVLGIAEAARDSDLGPAARSSDEAIDSVPQFERYGRGVSDKIPRPGAQTRQVLSELGSVEPSTIERLLIREVAVDAGKGMDHAVDDVQGNLR